MPLEVSDILDAVDMAEYIGQYTDLKEENGELWGLSPFREERTPSFSVRPESGFFYDFSAGFGGNLLDFIMQYDHIGLVPAINKLKAYAHITDDQQDGVASSRLAATKIAKKYRHSEKPVAKCTAKILPKNYMDQFEFKKEKLQPWFDEGIPWQVMRDYGVRYDALDNRIVYPIKDFDGNIFCVSGRTCDPNWKEKKLRKYTYTSSIGALPTIYGFSDHRQYIMESKEIILFEGCKSVLKMVGWGRKNCGALLTSHLSSAQFDFLVKLASFHGVRVVFALDSDVDIAKDENIKRLCSYARVEWVKNIDGLLCDKEAPVDRGLDVFEKLYAGRKRLN